MKSLKNKVDASMQVLGALLGKPELYIWLISCIPVAQHPFQSIGLF
jgi:hypothetical protein